MRTCARTCTCTSRDDGSFELYDSSSSSSSATWRRRLTVLDLADVADDDVADRYLVEVAAADDGELVLVLDLVLQAAELLLLAPVVEGGDEHDDDDRQQDGHALDPARLLLVPAVAH